MGGLGSGQSTGRPTADMALRIDISWMVRTGRAIESCVMSGSLHWTCGGEPTGSIGYRADMTDIHDAVLWLDYTRGSGDEREKVEQRVRLSFTVPHFGGRRWWMHCPYRGHRVGKLYLPGGGDRFASRKAWRLGYRSQRIASHDRSFEALFRLQKKLGCEQGWEAGLYRPKGMWQRTFERHLDRYYELDDRCARDMAGIMGLLRGW